METTEAEEIYVYLRKDKPQKIKVQNKFNHIIKEYIKLNKN